jgi:hypothetical protein
MTAPGELMEPNGLIERQDPIRMGTRATVASVALVTAIYVVGLLVTMETSTYETWGGMLVAPVLVLVSLPFLSRQATREKDRSLFWLLVAALLVKLAGALVFHVVAYDYYQGIADTEGYHKGGLLLAEQFRAGNYDTGPVDGVRFVQILAGIVYTLIGDTKLGGYMFFSWLGFWGLFFFYRAFTIAVPEGRKRVYARLLFFLPSLAFWPSSIGKEAWMMLALGVAALGTARVLSLRTWRGLLLSALGMWMAALIRPHVAALMAVGLAVGYLFRQPRQELRELAPIAKVLSAIVVGVVAAVVLLRAERFLADAGIDTERGVAGVQNSIAQRSSEGGSYFPPSILRSPTQAPQAVFTVMFRPHPLEAHNAPAVISSLENSFLLLLTILYLPRGLAVLRSVRRHPYVALALAYVTMFIIAFSSFANFGNLVRQRVQVLPLFLVLLCAVPRRRVEPVLPAPAPRAARTSILR